MPGRCDSIDCMGALPAFDEVPQNADRQAQGQQQGGGLVEGQAEAQHIDHLQVGTSEAASGTVFMQAVQAGRGAAQLQVL